MRDHQSFLVTTLNKYTTPRVAEVGVGCGGTSELLLANHPGLRLWMVDNWLVPKRTYTRRTQEQCDTACRAAIDRTEFARVRRVVLRLDSVQASGRFADNYFDLVFIDADHEYAGVRADLAAWWPTVRPGGVFCGHDIDSDKDKRGVWGVRQAVEEFCVATGVAFTVDKNVWVIEKPSTD